jgi:hypothetical protein
VLDSDLVRWITISKQFAAVSYLRSMGQKAVARGLVRSCCQGSDDVVAIVRYIFENPIRADLVVDVTEYPFWGSSTHSRDDLLASLERRT